MSKKDNTYVCSYNHCLHPGEKIDAFNSVVIRGKHYHLDCAQLREDIAECRRIYKEEIDQNVNFAVLSTIINRCLFEQGIPIDYLKFSIKHFAAYKTKIKSPFALQYLYKNSYMKKLWLKSKDNKADEN